MFDRSEPQFARKFVAGSSQYMEHSAALTTAYPMTCACWFMTENTTADQMLVGQARAAGFERSCGLVAGGAQANDPIMARDYNGSAVSALSTKGYLAGTWHHATAVFSASNARIAYLDGSNAGTNTTGSGGVTSTDRTVLGRCITAGSSSLLCDGAIAWPAIWNAALTIAEVLMLAQGAPPYMVRPHNLLAFWPLRGFDKESDYSGRATLTNNGSTVVLAPNKLVVPRQRVWSYALASPVSAPSGNRRRRFLIASS